MQNWKNAFAGSVFGVVLLLCTVGQTASLSIEQVVSKQFDHAFSTSGNHYQNEIDQSAQWHTSSLRELNFKTTHAAFFSTLAEHIALDALPVHHYVNSYYKTLFLYFISAKAP